MKTRDEAIRDLVKRLRASRAMWQDARGVPTPLEAEAADSIEALLAELDAARAESRAAMADAYRMGKEDERTSRN